MQQQKQLRKEHQREVISGGHLVEPKVELEQAGSLGMEVEVVGMLGSPGEDRQLVKWKQKTIRIESSLWAL